MIRSITFGCLFAIPFALGCGGNSTLSPTAPSPDFSLSISPATISIEAGGAGKPLSISAAALHGFSSPVTLTVSGLPSGVTASAMPTLQPGVVQNITLNASSGAVIGPAEVTIDAVSGSITQSGEVPLTVTPPTQDYSLDVTPQDLTLYSGGGAQTLTITAVPIGGFSSPVDVVLSGLTSDLVASPAGFTLTPGVSQVVSVSPAASATDQTQTLDIASMSGDLTHNASVGLTITTAALVTRGLLAYFPADEGSGITLSSTVGGYQAEFGGTGNTWSQIGVAMNGSGYISLPAAMNSALTVQIYVSQPNNPSSYMVHPYLLLGTAGSANAQWLLYSQPTTLCCSGFQPATLLIAGSGGIGAGSYTPFAGQNTLSLAMGLASNSTNDTFYIGADQTVMGQVQSVIGGGQIGGNYIVGSNLQGTIGPSAYYNVQLTAQEIAQNATYFNSVMSTRGIPRPSNVNLEAINQFVALGDSITYGFYGPYPYCTYITPTDAYGITCLGSGGKVTAFGVTEAPQVALWAATNARTNIFFIDYITNDILESIPASVSIANLAETCTEIKQVYPGSLAVVGTVMSLMQPPGFDAVKDATNPLIRQMATNGQSGCDGFIDMASDPVLGADGASMNPLYFNSDYVHPVEPGYEEMGGIATRYINSVDGTTEASPTVVSSNTYAMTTADNFVRWTPTMAATGTLPECIGMLGTPTRGLFVIQNASGMATITMSGLVGAETISGSSTIAPNSTANFQVVGNPDAVAGCTWVSQ